MNATPPESTGSDCYHDRASAQLSRWWQEVALAVRSGNARRARRVLRWIAAISPEDKDVQLWLDYLSFEPDSGLDAAVLPGSRSRSGKGAIAKTSIQLAVVGVLVAIALLASAFLPLYYGRADLLEDTSILPDSLTATALPAAAPNTTPLAVQAPPCAWLPQPGEPLAALVNDQGISLQLFDRAFAQLLAELDASNVDVQSAEAQVDLPMYRRQVLDRLVADALVEQAAVQASISVTNEDIEAYLDREVGSGEVRAQFRAQLEARGGSWEEFERQICQTLLRGSVLEQVTQEISATVEMVSARQIVVATQQDAQAVLTRLAAGEDFAAIAQELSIDGATREQGGDLGWFPAGLGLVPLEIERAAFAGTPGLVQGPILVGGLYYLVQTTEHEDSRPLDADMQLALREAEFERWLADQATMADIEVFVELHQLPEESAAPSVAPVTGENAVLPPWVTLIVLGLSLVIMGATLGVHDQLIARK